MCNGPYKIIVCAGPPGKTTDLEVALTETTTKHTSDGGVVTETTKDIYGYYLAEELDALKPLLPFSAGKPEALLEYLAENSRFPVFPNVFTALRNYLTLPITVASDERRFSKLKLIQTYLRSTMSQDRLNDMAVLSIDSDIARTID